MSTPNRLRRRGATISALAVLLVVGVVVLIAQTSADSQTPADAARNVHCVPKRLNVSAQMPGTALSVSPLPGSRDAMPQTQISLLGVPARELSDVRVVGSQTGAHSGRLRSYLQGDGASFVPAKPFDSGELVSVHGRVRTAGGMKRFSFQFTVAYPDPIPLPKPHPPSKPAPGSVHVFHSAPTLVAPSIYVTRDEPSQVSPGDIFLAPYSGPGATGPIIVNPQGQLVWMDALRSPLEATNLQVETYEGKPVLTWWQGYIPPQGFGIGEEIVANTSYKTILRIKAGNGNRADLHDFHLEPDHTAVLTVFRTIHCNLTSVGGSSNAAVTDGLYQEIDTKTGLVRREWTNLDRVPLGRSYSSAENARAEWPFDFFHINSIDPRENGTTLISSRNTSAMYVTNTKTGQVIQTIGGKKSSVSMGNGTHGQRSNTTRWASRTETSASSTTVVLRSGNRIQRTNRAV